MNSALDEFTAIAGRLFAQTTGRHRPEKLAAVSLIDNGSIHQGDVYLN
jgi:hypothetical protein